MCRYVYDLFLYQISLVWLQMVYQLHTIRSKAIVQFYVATMFLYYILQKIALPKLAYFAKIYYSASSF
jgi:hypothetical protein